MTCPRLDHWGMSVETEAQLDDYLDRAKKFREEDSRVDIVDKHVEDYTSLQLKSFYVAYLLPMMLEVQYYDFKDLATRRPVGADVEVRVAVGEEVGLERGDRALVAELALPHTG